MKRSTRVICFLFICLFFSPSVFAQTNWVKYESNPILSPGSAGNWDSNVVGSCSVMKDGDDYKMWYRGQDSSLTSRIGYATSVDGVTWTKHGIVLEPTPGSWDSAYISAPFVMKDDGVYRMWYCGATDIGGIARKIGYAESTDGISWIKHPNFVLEGDASEWDAYSLGNHPVIKEDGTFKMWYGAENAYGGIDHIGYATSADGINWTKYAGNPVFLAGSANWNSDAVVPGTLMKKDNTYMMWFFGQQGSEINIGYATSEDGIVWNEYGENPVLEIDPASSWESSQVAAPAVLEEETGYRMYYTGVTSHGVAHVGMATDGPVAYWSFDNESDPGYDDSGNGHNGTLFGEGDEWSSNGLNCSGALDLDGEDDYLEVPYSSALDVNGWPEGALSAWFKINSFDSRDQTGMIYADLGSADFSGMTIRVYYEERSLIANWRNGQSIDFNYQINTTGELTLDAGVWYHTALVYSSSGAKLYLNGILVGENNVPKSTNGQSNNNNPIRIGDRPIGIYSPDRDCFNGLIDDVRVYNYALSEESIQHIAQSTINPDADMDGYLSDVDCNDCDAAVNPGAAELCDGIDNDCNGDIDEVYPVGDECTVGEGECERTGMLVCSEDLLGTECDAEPGEPSIELPDDGLDNDCDGEIDEPTECMITLNFVDQYGPLSGAGAQRVYVNGIGYLNHGDTIRIMQGDSISYRAYYAQGSGLYGPLRTFQCIGEPTLNVEFTTLTMDFEDQGGDLDGKGTGLERVYIDHVGYKADNETITVPLDGAVYHRAYYQQGSGLYGPKNSMTAGAGFIGLIVRFRTMIMDFEDQSGDLAGTGNERVYIYHVGYKADDQPVSVPLDSTVNHRAYYQQGSGLYGPKLSMAVGNASVALPVSFRTLIMDFEDQSGDLAGTGNERVYIDHVGYKADDETVSVPLDSTVNHRAYYQQGSGLYGPKLSTAVGNASVSLPVSYRTLIMDFEDQSGDLTGTGNERVYIDHVGYKADDETVSVPLDGAVYYKAYYQQGSGLYGPKNTLDVLAGTQRIIQVLFQTLTMDFEDQDGDIDGLGTGNERVYIPHVGYKADNDPVSVPLDGSIQYRAYYQQGSGLYGPLNAMAVGSGDSEVQVPFQHSRHGLRGSKRRPGGSGQRAGLHRSRGIQGRRRNGDCATGRRDSLSSLLSTGIRALRTETR